MQFASFFSGYPNWLDRTLNYLDNMFWQDQQSIDYQTPAFYVYKPYPSSISGKRLESWVKLQERALSPYKNGDCYSISLKKGVAIWLSKTTFSGMPETAHQQAFDDGTWIVKGQRLAYRQVWQDGILLRCDSYPVSSLPEGAETLAAPSNANSWAQSRRIDEFIRKPLFGFSVIGFIASLLAVYIITAYLVQTIEVKSLEEKMDSLNESVGATLSIRDSYQTKKQRLDMLLGWREETGFLPETLANVVDTVSQQTAWKAGKIHWQGKVLKITLFAKELDITALVKTLEDSNLFESVSIRPQEQAHLWTLEVKVID